MNLHIVVPAYHEPALEESVYTLATMYPEASITVAEDGDYNKNIPRMTALNNLKVAYNNSHERRGKGWAIQDNLQPGIANAVYDADMAVHPYNLSPMLSILEQRGGLVIAKRQTTNRSLTRTTTSKLYNLAMRLMFRTGVSDHQCGCKILSPQATEIATRLKSNGFFWDTELIVECKKAGLTVTEYPVAWTEHKAKSTVNLAKDGFRMFSAATQLYYSLTKDSLQNNLKSLSRHSIFYASKKASPPSKPNSPANKCPD